VTGPGADVAVVGAGLVGTSLAYELVSAGASIVLIDRHDRGRATDAGAGILSPETNQDPDPWRFEFGRQAVGHYETLVGRLRADGETDTGYAVTGSVLVAERPGDDVVMEAAVTLTRSRCPEVREIAPEEAGARFPPLAPVRRALFNPAGRRVDGRTLNRALVRAAASRGLRTLDASVTGFEADPGARTVRRVITSAGPVTAEAVVVAGGAWSDRTAGLLDAAVPVAPLKGQIVHLLLPGRESRDWCIVQPVLGFYLVPWPDGRVACGGTMESEAGFDDRPTADGVHQLLRECLRTAPGLAQATLAEVRVGSRPASSDGWPILGRLPGWSNVWVATGHGAEGLLLGPYSARLVAAQVLAGLQRSGATWTQGEEERADALLERCAPGRFSDRAGS